MKNFAYSILGLSIAFFECSFCSKTWSFDGHTLTFLGDGSVIVEFGTL